MDEVSKLDESITYEDNLSNEIIKKKDSFTILLLLVVLILVTIILLLKTSKRRYSNSGSSLKQSTVIPISPTAKTPSPNPILVHDPIISTFSNDPNYQEWNFYHVDNLTFKLSGDFADMLDQSSPGIYRLIGSPRTLLLLSAYHLENQSASESAALFLNQPVKFKLFHLTDSGDSDYQLSLNIDSIGLDTSVKSIDLNFDSHNLSVDKAEKLFEEILKTFSYDPNGSILITPTPLPNKILWRTFTNKRANYTVQYPWPILGYPGLNLDTNVFVYSLSETKEAYRNCGGPGECSYFSSDLSRVDEQFALLSQVSQSPNCMLSADLKEKINKNFKLLTKGIESKYSINSIYYSDLNTCGMEYYGPDDYMLYPGAYYYKTAFYLNNKIVAFTFQLFDIFPDGLLPKYDALRAGFHINDQNCDSNCQQKFEDYSKNINYDDPGLQELVHIFRQTVSTFKFLN